jgi:hypothetical protein
MHTRTCNNNIKDGILLSLMHSILRYQELGSSVCIVSGYGLDDRAIGFRSPAEVKHFSSSLCVQTGSEANLASCPMGIGGPFPGAKAQPGRDPDHSPYRVTRSGVSRSHTSSTPSACMACSGTALAFMLRYLMMATSQPKYVVSF